MLRFCLVAALALASALPAGCASRRLGLDQVTITAAPDANADSAIAVDVVLAARLGVGEQLAKLSAVEWFNKRKQMMRDNPDDLIVLSWELVPGQSVSAQVGREVMDGYVFASYSSPGDHRVRLTLEGAEARILLQAAEFTVDGLKKPE